MKNAPLTEDTQIELDEISQAIWDRFNLLKEDREMLVKQQIMVQAAGHKALASGDMALATHKLVAGNEIKDEIVKLDNAISAQAKKVQQAKKKIQIEVNENTKLSDVDEAAMLMKTNNMAYVADTQTFEWCIDTAQAVKRGEPVIYCNPIFRSSRAITIVDVLDIMAGRELIITPQDVVSIAKRNKRAFQACTVSLNSQKWDETKFYNKASVIRKFWVTPDYELFEKDGYDAAFDFLFNCIGGGKKENIEHLEQWLVYKHRFPEKASNIPNLDIGGSPGGNGKGTLVTLCKTIFTSPCIVQAAMKELNDGFNQGWEMAFILHFDETERDSKMDGAFKKSNGSDEVRIEKKGRDATMSDRLFNQIFTSNNEDGVHPLCGRGPGSEDRRVSVITTNKVMTKEAEKEFGFSPNDALLYVNDIASRLVRDRTEVSKFMAHLYRKHANILTGEFKALHGEDYYNRVGSLKTDDSIIMEAIVNLAVKDGGISSSILRNVYEALTGCSMTTPKKFGELCKTMGHVFEKRSSVKVVYNFGGNQCKVDRQTYYALDKNVTTNIVNCENYLDREPNANVKDWALDGLVKGKLTIALQDLIN